LYATKVAERVYLIDTMALGQANTVSAFVIKAPKVTLVDCGYATSYQNVLAGLADVGIAPSEVRYVIPTHVHLDHAGAAGRLLKEMPNAQVISHEKGTPHLVDPSRLIESATRVFGKAIMEMYGAPEPIPSDRITSVGSEMHLELGGGVTATLVHAPGHAPHQLAVLLDSGRTLLTADAVSIAYPGMKVMIPTTPPPSFDPKTLVSTVSELAQTDPNALLIPHFGARKDSETVFEKTRQGVLDWVNVVRDLKKAGKSLDEITDEMVARITTEEGVDDIPIYAKVSIRTSAMGILVYLEKNA
jgi:glyoxylase-like metal-dependent hydrolase (beta-lactamase superfamily II)